MMFRQYRVHLLLATVILGILSLTWKITSGQFRVNMAAPVQLTPRGGVTSIRYGSISPALWNVSRGGGGYVRSRALRISGGGGYVRASSGMFTIRNRFLRASAAYLPYTGRLGRQTHTVNFPTPTIPYATIGSIRYSGKPVSGGGVFRPSQSVTPVKVTTSTRPAFSSSLQSAVANGSIRYGTSTKSFLKVPISSRSPLSSPKGISSMASTSNLLVVGTSRPFLNLNSARSLHGSIRYGGIRSPSTIR